MKVAVITSIFGGIDELKTFPEQTVNCTRFVFTERNTPLVLHEYNDRNKAIFFKTQHHRVVDADYFIWVDGKIQITSDDFVQQCMAAIGNGDIAIMKHLYRSCIYEEIDHIEHCIKAGNEYLITRYANRPIRKEVEDFRKAGYPKDAGLSDCCMFIRKNNASMNGLFNEWWDRCAHKQSFDQVSIRFLCWQYGIEIKPIVFKPGTYTDVPHKKMM